MDQGNGLLLNFFSGGGAEPRPAAAADGQKPRKWTQKRAAKRRQAPGDGPTPTSQPQPASQQLKGYSLDFPTQPAQASPLRVAPAAAKPSSNSVGAKRQRDVSPSPPPPPQQRHQKQQPVEQPQQPQQPRPMRYAHDKRMGRLRQASKQGGEREATPDQDDIQAGSDADEEDLLAVIAASLAKDKEVQAELGAAPAAEPPAAYHSDSDSDSDQGGGEGKSAPLAQRLPGVGEGDERLLEGDGVVDFDLAGSDYPTPGENKGKRDRKAAAKLAGGAVRPGQLTHAPGAAAAVGAAAQELFEGQGEGFQALGVSEVLAKHLKGMGFAQPTRVQQQAIPALLAGRDALINAPTGSGKTLAYLIPILQDLSSFSPRLTRADGTHALILAPTRELCLQVSDVLTLLARRFAWLVPGVVNGGESRAREKARLRKGITILVATPGRLLDHFENTQAFKADALRWLILDEADRLLDMGFEKKIAEILGVLEDRETAAGSVVARRSALLSATLHGSLGRLAALSLQDPVAVGFTHQQGPALAGGAAGGAAPHQPDQLHFASPSAGGGEGMESTPAAELFSIPTQLQQRFVEVPCKLRLVALAALLKARLAGDPERAKLVVFFSNCDSVELHHAVFSEVWPFAVGSSLFPAGTPLLKLHGNMNQADRTASLVRFTKAAAGVLLCTDVAARGLDFPAVTSIVQFDPPGEAADYVHRVGRTARLGRGGDAALFLLPAERGYVGHLQRQGVVLQEERVVPLLDRVLGAGSAAASASAWQDPERHHGAFALQKQLMDGVGRDRRLQALAAGAFRSYVRAYATHSSELKEYFQVKGLHLGHVAHSFALRERPGLVGKSSLKEGTQRRKAEALKATHKEKRRKHVAAAQGGAALKPRGMGGYVLS